MTTLSLGISSSRLLSGSSSLIFSSLSFTLPPSLWCHSGFLPVSSLLSRSLSLSSCQLSAVIHLPSFSAFFLLVFPLCSSLLSLLLSYSHISVCLPTSSLPLLPFLSLCLSFFLKTRGRAHLRPPSIPSHRAAAILASATPLGLIGSFAHCEIPPSPLSKHFTTNPPAHFCCNGQWFSLSTAIPWLSE